MIIERYFCHFSMKTVVGGYWLESNFQSQRSLGSLKVTHTSPSELVHCRCTLCHLFLWHDCTKADSIESTRFLNMEKHAKCSICYHQINTISVLLVLATGFCYFNC